MIAGGLTKCGALVLPPSARLSNSGSLAERDPNAVPLGLANTELNAATLPRFETASVNTVSGGRQPSIKESDSQIEYSNFRLSALILQAYPAAECQILWPPWLQYDSYYGWPGANIGMDRVHGGTLALMDRFGPFFDLTVTFPHGTSKPTRQLMLRALLSDRFKLALHRAILDVPVYSVTAKHCRLLRVAAPTDGNAAWGPGRWAVGDLSVPAGSSSMRVAQLLAGINNMIFELDRPLVNRTGLEGYYSFEFSMPREPVTTMQVAFDAMKKQLGLVVEEETLRAEMLVIDKVEKIPSRN